MEYRTILFTGTVYYDGKRVTRDEIEGYIRDYNERIQNAGQGIIVIVCDKFEAYRVPIMLVLGKLKKGSATTTKLSAVDEHNVRADRYNHYKKIPIVDENHLWQFLGLVGAIDPEAELTDHTYDI